MTAYVANHRKKLNIFRKREDELRHAIKHKIATEKIHRAAERVREAKFAVFKSNFSQHSVLPASQFSLEVEADCDPMIRKWLELTTAEIIEEYERDSN